MLLVNLLPMSLVAQRVKPEHELKGPLVLTLSHKGEREMSGYLCKLVQASLSGSHLRLAHPMLLSFYSRGGQ